MGITLEKLPRSRAEAIKLGETKYFPNKRCLNGHLTYYYTGGRCSTCAKLAADKYRKANYAEYKAKKYHRKHLPKPTRKEPSVCVNVVIGFLEKYLCI